MFKNFFSGKKTELRKLETANQLSIGDIIQLKYRESLPPELRECQFEVSKVGTYEYSSGISKEIVLKNEYNHIFFMSVEEDDGDMHLCFAKKISRKVVNDLFDMDDFSQLWNEHWVELVVQDRGMKAHSESLKGWLAGHYSQTIKEQEAYYYDRDCLGEDLSEANDGEELRYHECEGNDDHYGLNIETSSDGSTDVFLQVYCPMDVIEEMWPHGD